MNWSMDWFLYDNDLRRERVKYQKVNFAFWTTATELWTERNQTKGFFYIKHLCFLKMYRHFVLSISIFSLILKDNSNVYMFSPSGNWCTSSLQSTVTQHEKNQFFQNSKLKKNFGDWSNRVPGSCLLNRGGFIFQWRGAGVIFQLGELHVEIFFEKRGQNKGEHFEIRIEAPAAYTHWGLKKISGTTWPLF